MRLIGFLVLSIGFCACVQTDPALTSAQQALAMTGNPSNVALEQEWQEVVDLLLAGDEPEPRSALFAFGRLGRIARLCSDDEAWVELPGRFHRDPYYAVGTGSFGSGLPTLPTTPDTCRILAKVLDKVVEGDLSWLSFEYPQTPSTLVHCLFPTVDTVSGVVTQESCRSVGGFIVPEPSVWAAPRDGVDPARKTPETFHIVPMTFGDLRATAVKYMRTDGKLTHQEIERRRTLANRTRALEERFKPR